MKQRNCSSRQWSDLSIISWCLVFCLTVFSLISLLHSITGYILDENLFLLLPTLCSFISGMISLYFLTTSKPLMKDPIPNGSSCLRLVPFLKLPLKKKCQRIFIHSWSYYWYTVLLWNPCFKIPVTELYVSVCFVPILTISHWSNCSCHWLLLELHNPKGKTFLLGHNY